MPRSFLLFAAIIIPAAALAPQIGGAFSGEHSISMQPIAASTVEAGHQTGSEYPARVIIPSIGLDAPIQNVGVNSLGQMDVPAGSTDNVGWYAFGTVPGTIGSAVLDAHVFAAFSKLKYLKVGSDITIQTVGGKLLKFVVTDSQIYELADVPLQRLFNTHDAARLNLITCAGDSLPDGSTYDHRLVVYAQLAS